MRLELLRFEDLASSPSTCLAELLEFLELPSLAHELSVAHVASNTNRKYEKEYCESFLQSEAQRVHHCAVANALQPTISMLGLGYDIRYGNQLGFECVGASLGAEREGCEATPLGPVAGLLEVLPTAYGEPTPDGLTLPLESGDALSLGRLVCRALDV